MSESILNWYNARFGAKRSVLVLNAPDNVLSLNTDKGETKGFIAARMKKFLCT